MNELDLQELGHVEEEGEHENGQKITHESITKTTWVIHSLKWIAGFMVS